MNNALVRLSSVTYAIRAQQVLEKHGIRSHLKRVKGNMRVSGCGYALDIQGDVDAARGYILAAGIRIVE